MKFHSLLAAPWSKIRGCRPDPWRVSTSLPGDMSMEELLEKYKGAYASDFEVPSASGSKASSDSEVSGDEEVETEEDESDVESNTSSSGIKLLIKTQNKLFISLHSEQKLSENVFLLMSVSSLFCCFNLLLIH